MSEPAPSHEHLSKFYKVEVEAVHRQLYKFHKDVAHAAGGRIERALEVLHRLERKDPDCRQEVRKRIAQLEALREDTTKLWHKSGEILSYCIEKDGCDATCHMGNA